MGLGQILLCTRHMSTFCLVVFFAESLTAMHPGGSEVEGPFRSLKNINDAYQKW